LRKNRLDAIFKPDSIAIIGASKKVDSNSQPILKNLIGSDYQGVVYPVSTSAKSIHGVKAYKNIKDIPESVDLGIIDAEVSEMEQIIDDCIEAKVKGVVILSGGFRLEGEKGTQLYDKIKAKAKAAKLTILGASSYGFVVPSLGLNATLFNDTVLPGKIAFISQSRSICNAILNWASAENVGFSSFVSVGSMMDVQLHELIDYFGVDMHTRSILIYMESLSEARRFMSAARAFARNKPIIILKAGQTPMGASIIYNHSHQLAGNDAIFQALCRRAGVLKVDTIEGLFDCAEALSSQPRPKSNRLAIVTNAGAPAILAVDYLIKNGGKLAQFTPETTAELREILPNNRFNGNPVDVLANSTIERYQSAVNVCLKDKNVAGVLTILTSQTKSDVRGIAKEITKINNKTQKTLLSSCVGELSRKELSNILSDGNVPTYGFPESAVYSFLKMYEYNRNIELLYETPAEIPQQFAFDKKTVQTIIEKAFADNRNQLTLKEGVALLNAYEIPSLDNYPVATVAEAVQKARKIGYPVVLKAHIDNVFSKTKTKTIALNLDDDHAVEYAWKKITRNASVYKHFDERQNLFLQKMIEKPYQLSIKTNKTADLGPVISFGMGGIAEDLFNDVNYGIPPLNMALAQRIIENTKVYKLLNGYGGGQKVNIDSIRVLLMKISYLIADFPQIRSIDINPFSVGQTGGIVIDFNIRLDFDLKDKIVKPFKHLIISPYPAKYTKTVTTRDGQKVTLRPIKPEDEPLERAMVEHFSENTFFLRFFTNSVEVTHEFLSRFTNIDYDREMAIVAILEEEGEEKMIGVVRIVGDADNISAEYAIVIADPWQGIGLGKHLTEFILEIAKDMGFEQVDATLLRQNRGMKAVFEKYGFEIKSVDLETLSAVLRL
jgi:acetyltransferase